MWRAFLIVAIASLCCDATQVTAQEARTPPPDSGKPTHGIIRKAQPKSPDPVKVTPAASTEAVAAAIAAAVRSVEATKKPTPAPHPRAVRPQASAVAQRRYTVNWPSQRIEVSWETADERIGLSWTTPGLADAYARDDRRLEP
jgi:hypothetical protein